MKTFKVFTGFRDIEISLQDKNYLYYAIHKDHTPSISQEELIDNALDHPYDSEGLDHIPENAKVIILIDDATRPTPSKPIIPHILERVEKRTKNITFVTAPGTHRPLNEKDLEDKIGSEYLKKYNVVNVDYKIPEDYKYIGETQMGTPLYIHKAVLHADYKIAIGNIAPHNVVGWGGGAKILMPGVSGEITTSSTHLAGSYYKLLDVYGNINCRMRKEVDDIGGRVGLDFIVNTVLDSNKLILGLFCGHYIKAHRAGVSFAKECLCPVIPALADIVIVSAYPCNMDYWQGFKPIGFSMAGVKTGGTIIYLLDPREGLCNNSPAHKAMVQKYIKTSEQTIREDIKQDKITDIVGITNPLYHLEMLDHVKNVICISDGLTEEECNLLSFKKAENIEQALELAFTAQGPDARVGIIPFGGETLVRLAE